VVSLFQRLRSFRHGFWYGVSERLRWSRGAYRETPAIELPGVAPEVGERIAALQCRYQMRFELQLSAASSLKNYEYLDILDRGWQAAAIAAPAGGSLCDVGCANFWYAASLQAFFRPTSLLGVDVEGHRLYRDGRTRVDYAAGYLAQLPHARFLVADYARLQEPADLITAWFPFLTPAAILAWRLPLSLLTPQALFARISRNLRPAGQFVMVNHGLREAAIAENWCIAAGLRRRFRSAEQGVLSRYRAEPPVLSCWSRASAHGRATDARSRP
jgi:SAM-dependent methyltransferase